MSQAVVRLCTDWHRLDRAEMRAMFTDDATYRNMAFAPSLVGADGIADFFAAGAPQLRDVEVVISNVARDGDVVFVERTEAIHTLAGETVSIPVTGVFELRGDLIAAWRDYCDGGLLKRVQRSMSDGQAASGSS